MRRLRRPSVLAALLVGVAVLAGAVVVLVTDARADVLGPVLVFGVAAATVLALLMPGDRPPR